MFTLGKEKWVNEKIGFGYRSQASSMDNLHYDCFAGDLLFCLSDNRLQFVLAKYNTNRICSGGSHRFVCVEITEKGDQRVAIEVQLLHCFTELLVVNTWEQKLQLWVMGYSVQ